MHDDLTVTSRIVIPGGELDLQFTTSSGPGGQNVNRVQTRATLRWSMNSSEAPLAPSARARLASLAGSRLTKDGVIVMSSDTYRSQARNLADVRERLADLVRRSLQAPKRRKPTRLSRGARERRKKEKKRRSSVKESRRKPRGDHD